MAVPNEKPKKKSLLVSKNQAKKMANLDSGSFRTYLEQRGLEPDDMPEKEKLEMMKEMLRDLGFDPMEFGYK